MDNTKHAVAATGLLVAAMRAEESARDDALFHDPFAERLAGDDGRRLLAESSSETGQPSAPIVVRTRLFDEALLRAHADGVSQVVIVAAGMDARCYRLPWRDGATVYEVDQPQVIAIKDERLAGERPRCRRVALGVDLADDWPKALESQGFDSSAGRSGWSRVCCSTSTRRRSTGCSHAWTRCRRRVRCCSTTSLARPCWKRRSCRHPEVHAKAGRAMGFRQRYTGRPGRGPRLECDGHRYGRTRQRVEAMGAPGDSGRCARTRRAATSSRRSRPEALSTPPPCGRGALPPGPPALLLISLSPGSADSSSCLRAVRLRRDRRELGGAVLGERGIVLLQMLDQVQTGHAVVDMRAHRLAGADGLARVAVADAHLVQVRQKRRRCSHYWVTRRCRVRHSRVPRRRSPSSRRELQIAVSSILLRWLFLPAIPAGTRSWRPRPRICRRRQVHGVDTGLCRQPRDQVVQPCLVDVPVLNLVRLLLQLRDHLVERDRSLCARGRGHFGPDAR